MSTGEHWRGKRVSERRSGVGDSYRSAVLSFVLVLINLGRHFEGMAFSE